MPTPLLFDLDGTLVDTIGLILASARHAFADFDGHRPSDDEWRALIGRPLSASLRVFARDETEAEQLFQRYAARILPFLPRRWGLAPSGARVANRHNQRRKDKPPCGDVRFEKNAKHRQNSTVPSINVYAPTITQDLGPRVE